MRHSDCTRVLIGVTLACLAGCASAPGESFHTLSATAEATQAAAADSTGALSVSVDRINLPDAVDRPQFVIRVDANRVRILEQQRWAEPLRSAIPRVVAEDIGRLLGSDGVNAYPRDAPAGVAYRIALDVTRFESQVGEGVTVEVNWMVRAPESGASRSGRTLARETIAGPGYATLAAAHSRALATVSADIARAIAALKSAPR